MAKEIKTMSDNTNSWITIESNPTPEHRELVWVTILNVHSNKRFVIGENRIYYSKQQVCGKEIGWLVNSERFEFIYPAYKIIAWKYKEKEPEPYML